jgi:hypothetical protein
MRLYYPDWATLVDMWTLMISLGLALAAECPLGVVQPSQEQAIQAPIQTVDGLRQLPRGSLVRQVPMDCAEGVGVEVISRVYLYQASGTAPSGPGDRGCMMDADLVGSDSFHFMALPPPPGMVGGLGAGQVLGPVEDAADCAAVELQFGEQAIPVDQLSWIRALSPELLSQTIELQDRWLRRYGPVMMGRVWLSDWGYLSLPMLRYRDVNQLQAEWKREDLESTEQRERAVSALGPESFWLHFLGADARFSDSWGRPETVASLAELAQDWTWWCAGMEIAERERCILQIGDIAWYNSRLPDPLGHTEHYAGRCVDLRLFRKDGSRYEAYWNQVDDRPAHPEGYDQELTQAFVDFALQRPEVDVLYFNDPEVLGAEPSAGHDDHIHLCFAAVIEPKNE